MTLHLVTTADQNVVPAFAGDDEIVGDEPMAPLDEIEHALGLADSALAAEEDADAENIGE